MTQLALPFLTVDDAATIDAARVAVDRAHGNALAARRLLEADELARLGAQLVGILERNATAVRGAVTGEYVSDWKTLRALTRSLPPGLGRTAREMYHLLCGHTAADGMCNVSIETLAAELDRNAGTVRRARAELERRGLIVTFVGGGNRSNLYRIVGRELSPPRGSVRGVTPRKTDADPAQNEHVPRASVRDEEEKNDEERAHVSLDDTPPAFVDADSARDWLEARRR